MTDARDWDRSVVPGVFRLAGQGVKLVAVTGTAIALRATVPCKIVSLKARAANAGTIYFGSSSVTNDETVLTGGLQLAPGDWQTFAVDDLANVYINGTAGDGVSFAYWT